MTGKALVKSRFVNDCHLHPKNNSLAGWKIQCINQKLSGKKQTKIKSKQRSSVEKRYHAMHANVRNENTQLSQWKSAKKKRW